MVNNRFKSIIRWTIAGMCLTYILLTLWQQREHVVLTFSLNPSLIPLVLLLLVIYFLLRSYSYHLVLEKCSGISIPYWNWFQIFILGLFLNNFVPQMGNVYRSIRLKKDYQVSYTRYISTYLSFAWMDMCLNMVIATIVIMIIGPNLQISGINAAFFSGILTLIIVLVPMGILRVCRLIEPHMHYTSWIHSKLSEIFEVTVVNLQDLQYISKIIGMSVMTFAQMCLIFYICFRCFDLYLTLPVMALFNTLLQISSYLSLSPGNLGIQELAYGILSEQLHIGMAQGILVSAIFRVLVYIVLFSLALPMGGLNLLCHGKRYQPDDSETYQ